MCGAVPIPWDFRDFEKLFVLISFLLDAYVHFELLLDASQTEAATETFLLLKKKTHSSKSASSREKRPLAARTRFHKLPREEGPAPLNAPWFSRQLLTFFHKTQPSRWSGEAGVVKTAPHCRGFRPLCIQGERSIQHPVRITNTQDDSITDA